MILILLLLFSCIVLKGDHCKSEQIRRRRRFRTTFTTEQIAELEEEFMQCRYLTPTRATELSNKLKLRSTQIQNWFKNRRRRQKLQAQDYVYDMMEPSSPSSASPPNLDASPTLVPATIPDIVSDNISDHSSVSDIESDSVTASDPLTADLPTILPTTIGNLSSFEISDTESSVLSSQDTCLTDPIETNNIESNTINVIENDTLTLNNDTEISASDESENCSININAPAPTMAYSDKEINQSKMLQIASSKMSPEKTQFQAQPLEKKMNAIITAKANQESSPFKLNEQNPQSENFRKIAIDHNYNDSYYALDQQQNEEIYLDGSVSKCIKSTQLRAFEKFYKPRSLRFDDNSSFSSGSGCNSTDSDDLEPTRPLKVSSYYSRSNN